MTDDKDDDKPKRIEVIAAPEFFKQMKDFQASIGAGSASEAIRRAVIFARRMSEPGTRAFVRRKDGTETEVVL
jgi:hypothetical protein